MTDELKNKRNAILDAFTAKHLLSPSQ